MPSQAGRTSCWILASSQDRPAATSSSARWKQTGFSPCARWSGLRLRRPALDDRLIAAPTRVPDVRGAPQATAPAEAFAVRTKHPKTLRCEGQRGGVAAGAEAAGRGMATSGSLQTLMLAGQVPSQFSALRCLLLVPARRHGGRARQRCRWPRLRLWGWRRWLLPGLEPRCKHGSTRNVMRIQAVRQKCRCSRGANATRRLAPALC